MAGKYDQVLDRKSAYEILKARAEQAAQEAAAEEARIEEDESLSPAVREFNAGRRYSGKKVSRSTSRSTRRKTESFGEAMTKVVIKELKGTTGRRIVRGILGGLFKGR